MANPIMNVLKPYVDEQLNREKLIAKSVLEAKNAKYLTLQVGVKGETALNLLNTEVVFGDGKECGLGEASTATITQRTIKPVAFKVNLPVCEKNLLGTYAQYQVKLKAGLETLPFEEYLLDSVSDKVQEKLNKMIWGGVASGSTLEFDGFGKILMSDGGLDISHEADKTITDSIYMVYNAVPESAHKDDLTIYVADYIYRQWIQELVKANMYHYNPNDKDGEYVLPGTNVKVVSTAMGNSGVNIVAARQSNLFYGVDIEDAAETAKVVYDDVNDMFYIKMLFNAGVQVAFPSEVAYMREW